MAAADLDADAASQQELQLVLLHGVGRREGVPSPRAGAARDFSLSGAWAAQAPTCCA